MLQSSSYATLRFYQQLNDFLLPEDRKVSFNKNFNGRVSVKDLIESVGVPHTEVDLILVNGESVKFSYIVEHADQISVYPTFESLDISALVKLQPQRLLNIRFVLDVHLGKLARYMRMLGFDVKYDNHYHDEELALLSHHEQRVLLTRDRGLLKRKIVEYGYFVRNTQSLKQLAEVIQSLGLKNRIRSFYRCMHCNGLLTDVSKQQVINLVAAKTLLYYDEFKQCEHCRRIYWKGSHYQKMQVLIERLLK